ncbi:hypothetical protein PR048_015207 [Dryococelus australis]|uniref:HAT C-terminal dimerisation domain-containing protein n=1 Tax=Dryococelus australis TaxID=614101 RepID=A0ABQ9HGB7_9NEOP|nr:hypothetical protein PR048_015207 [Dryococelus australis]
MQQRRNARGEEREIPEKTRRPTASSRRPGPKIRLIPAVRQEISLRSHRDSGLLTVEEPTNNYGNFRALLRLRAKAGDSLLNELLNSGRGNVTYISPTVQNELLNFIGKQIQETVVERIKMAKFFTVLGDETTDISRVEQFSLCVRYVDIDIVDIREDFLTFVSVYDVNGARIAPTIKTELQKAGFRYDEPTWPRAYAAKSDVIRNCLFTISEVATFSRGSAQRTKILKYGLEAAGIPNCAVHNYNDTRWVERHDCVAVFSESFLSVVQALELLIERGLVSSTTICIDVEKAIEFYKDDLQDTNRSILDAEWRLWKMSCRTPEHQTQATNVMTVCEVLKIIDKDSFPNMAVLLAILAVIPVTAASVDRSFSTLTCQRNKTDDERLAALTLMTVHRDVEDIVKQHGQIYRRLPLS